MDGWPATDVEFGEAWRDHRRYVLDVAFRMLGSISEAEDIVQEAFTRLLVVDQDAIDDVRGWLVVVVTRLCLDQLRSARFRRQVPGPVLSEPASDATGGVDPADRITLDDSVRTALLVVLERLSPAERAVFVLHDVFQFSFEDVASIVGRTTAACRQLASRARRHIQAETGPARFEVESAEQRRVTERFIAACSGGDLEALMEVLDASIVGEVEPGGAIPRRRPIAGRLPVARTLLGFFGTGSGATLVSMAVNGEPGVVAFLDGRAIVVLVLEVDNGLVRHIRAVGDPEKLSYLTSPPRRRPG